MNLNSIWNFYKNKYKKSKKKMPTSVMNIKNRSARTKKLIGDKFCSCVKKLEEKYGPRGIGFCTKAVFTTKGLERTGTFSCKPTNVSFKKIKKAKTKKHASAK